ncbi:MAG TPA: hypothetical protein VFX76_10395, partial [Roseiflexaceae bacterium]|nr:hypothetical protein [Roseiflexaceae bacterium]
MTITQAPRDIQPQSRVGQANIPAAIAGLFQALRERGVRYCHWKSNLRLLNGLQGQTDLDLLIDPQHMALFKQILADHGVKPVRAAPGREYPGLENYLAFDSASGTLFHLHVHYQLVLGEQFVKNYRLPLEAQFLSSTQQEHGVFIPVPELELIVLSLRALLKYRDRDVIKDCLTIRYPGLPEHIVNEIMWLLEQTSIARVSQRLAELGDIVPGDAILEFLKIVVATPRAGYRLFRLRQRVRASLRQHQRSNRLRATAIYFHELWRRRNTFLRFTPSRHMTMPGGGMTLALVGADGAGKST